MQIMCLEKSIELRLLIKLNTLHATHVFFMIRMRQIRRGAGLSIVKI